MLFFYKYNFFIKRKPLKNTLASLKLNKELLKRKLFSIHKGNLQGSLKQEINFNSDLIALKAKGTDPNVNLQNFLKILIYEYYFIFYFISKRKKLFC